MLILCVASAAAVSGCNCTPETPKAVTLRVKNSSKDPIYLDDTNQGLGLTVQRGVGGSYVSFVEAPACACQACDAVCSSASCTCPDPDKRVLRVAAGDSQQRDWAGVVQQSNVVSCSLGTTSDCLTPENAPYNETFNLHLCYSLSAKGVALNPDGGSAPGTLTSDQTCVDKEFRIDDGTVEISPLRGADCTTTADCRGMGELCFSGSCTASCPDNDYPTLGSNWALRVASPDDQGFFTSSMDGAHQVFTGTGTVSSAIYQGSTVTIRLTRTGASGELLTGAVYVTLPPMQLGPLVAGQAVVVKLVDGSTSDNPENRALLITDAHGSLLVAADMAQDGSLLTGADTAPFTVAFDATLVGCTTTGCGRELFSATHFTSPGQGLLLEPGKFADVVNTLGTYRLLNVSSGHYATTTCGLSDLRPWVIWRQKAAGQ